MSKKQKEKIEVICQVCAILRTICRGAYQQTIKRNGFYRCAKCSPQRTASFWADSNRKIAHSTAIKSSSAYYESLPSRELSGEKNGMYGKKHTKQTLDKMSKSRTGKVGKNATAWKGGLTSFNKRIKSLIQLRFNWFGRVFDRDNHKCVWCGEQNNLDAHHIDPVVKIIKRITRGLSFDSEEIKLEWVLAHSDIEDSHLKNGITLCRACHRKAHNNWGSHVNP